MEWTKLRTDPGARWCAFVLVASTVAVGALSASATDGLDCAPRPCMLDATRISLTGIYLGQIPAVVLAVLAVTTEYDSMMIRTTLAANPRRFALVGAKAAVVAAVVLAASAVALTATLIAARIVMPARGFTPAHGYPELLSLADDSTRRAYLGTMLYTGLVALLGLGTALVVRHDGAAITATLGMLYVAPIAALFVTDPLWAGRIQRYAPMPAGLAIQDTLASSARIIGPWAGLGVLAAYAGGALAAGAIAFRHRDA
jgi:ABC-2 type transport system permease protein